MKKKAIFLFGATATGKTAMALNIFENYNVHLISVDASQVYRGMDIGSAKLPKSMLAKYPHALIDICEPNQPYSSGRFRQDAQAELEKAERLQKIPVFVGGTMLYFKQLLTNADNLPEADAQFRAKMQKKITEQGGHSVFLELQKLDAKAAQITGEHNLQRIIRALEIHHLTDKIPSQIWAEQAQEPNKILQEWDFLQIGLLPKDRQILHKNIEIRWNQMLQDGFIAEVEALQKRGDLNLEMPSMRAVGYRQIWEYLNGAYSLEEANFKGLAATRQLAKRQITWIRSWENAQKFYSQDPNLEKNIFELINHFLEK